MNAPVPCLAVSAPRLPPGARLRARWEPCVRRAELRGSRLPGELALRPEVAAGASCPPGGAPGGPEAGAQAERQSCFADRLSALKNCSGNKRGDGSESAAAALPR